MTPFPLDNKWYRRRCRNKRYSVMCCIRDGQTSDLCHIGLIRKYPGLRFPH